MFLYKLNVKRSLFGICTGSLLVAIMLMACDKESNPGNTPGKAVVEGYLSPGNLVEVKITKEIPYGSGDTLLPLPDLSVFIISNGVSHQLTYAGNAIYSSSGIIIDAGVTYQLQFEYNGEQVSASTTIPQKPTNFKGSDSTLVVPGLGGGIQVDLPDPITYTWDNPDNDYHLLVVTCIEPNPVLIFDTTGGRRLSGSFRTQPTQAREQDIGFRSFSYYGSHRVVLYRIWAEYAALYESNESNSNNLTTPPGNITNGWGIFTGINTADTLYVTVQ